MQRPPTSDSTCRRHSYRRLRARYPRTGRSLTASPGGQQGQSCLLNQTENVAYHVYRATHERTPRRHDITIRFAKEAGRHADPAAFTAAASQAAANRNASILSAHTAEEIICVVTVAAVTVSQAVAVALAIVADALSAGDPQLSPSR